MIDAMVRRARLLLPLLLVALLLPLASPWLHERDGRIAWVLDLAVHWQWLYALALLPVVSVCALRSRRWLILAPLSLLPMITAAPRLGDASAASVDSHFTVVSANVHLATRDPQALFAWLADAPADAVVVVEVSPDYAQALSRWPDYPFRVIEPALDPFGIAVLSRHPLANAQVLHDTRGLASIDVAIDTPQGCVALRALHPMPPISPEDKAIRDRELAAAVSDLSLSVRPALIVGDFNATPWSSAFAPFARQGWRRATSLAPTWPAWGRGLVGIPIDQVLANAAWQRVDSTRGPDLGSDHFPVRVTLARAPSPRCDAG